MENYKILGVDESASMEEVRRAYENKVKEYSENIKDEKRAKAFIKVFDKAYEEIKLERSRNQYQQTMIMNSKEVDSRQNSKNLDRDNNEEYEEESTATKRKKKSLPCCFASCCFALALPLPGMRPPPSVPMRCSSKPSTTIS